MLILKDKTKFPGVSIGVKDTRVGNIILYTGVVGYQEVMTDPANAGKIVVMTYPLIGNYGINPKFNESKKVWAEGLIIKESSRMFSNWQAVESFESFLLRENTMCLSEVDTRTLTVKIREIGEQAATISNDDSEEMEDYEPISYLREISVEKPTHVVKGSGKKVVIVDLGVTNSTIKQLENLKCDVWLVSYNTPAKEILSMKPDRVIISNGPEEDPELSLVSENINGILGKVQVLGISTGHEVIAAAIGGKLEKLKLGHRGCNYPVVPEGGFKGEITFQNHSYVVEEFSLDKDVDVTEKNLNDETVEKMESKKMKFVSVQYYLNSPGLGEPHPLLAEFVYGGKIHAKA